LSFLRQPIVRNRKRKKGKIFSFWFPVNDRQ
jgi:hypothetical protein